MLDWDKIRERNEYPKRRKENQPLTLNKQLKTTPATQMSQATAASIVGPKMVSEKKTSERLTPRQSFQSVLDEYNMSLPGIGNQIAKTLPEDRRKEIAQGTKSFFEKAPVMAGLMQGVALNNPIRTLENKLDQKIDISEAEKDPLYQAGKIGGIAAQFAVPYAGASGAVGKGVAKLIPNAGKLTQSIAKSVATDAIVGTPLNINYALNKEELRGSDAVKSIAQNTAIDLLTGGVLEVAPSAIKAITSFAKKQGWTEDAVSQAIKQGDKTVTEAVQSEMPELERLAYESNVRKGKITPQNDTLYGSSFRAAAEELPAPGKTVQTKIETPEEAFTRWRKENFGGAFGKMSKEDMQALRELYLETTQPNYAAAAGSKEVPRTITRNELPASTIDKPVDIPKADMPGIKPIEIKPPKEVATSKIKAKETFNIGEPVIGIERGNKGTIAKQNADGSFLVHFKNKETGKEALIKMNRSEFEPVNQTINNMEASRIPKASRDNFNAEILGKTDKDYEEFMKETADLPDKATGAGEFATSITGKGVVKSKDIQRLADAAYRNNKAGREHFKTTVETPLYESKGAYTASTKKNLDTLYNDVVKDLGIKKGSKESAGLQWYGEGVKQRRSGKDISTETTPYTITELMQDYGYKMPNGKKAWENIVEAEKTTRKMYDDYIGRINESLRKIYPNVEEDVKKLQEKLMTAKDTETRTKILQEIEDAQRGKRLFARKDYYRHFQDMNNNFLVGLDNIINGATNIDPRLIGVSEFTKPSSKWTGILQKRKDGDIYTEDAIGGLLEYIPQAEYKINIEPNIPILRSVIKELKESTIDSRNANSFIDNLMQITNDLAGKTNKWDRNFADLFGDEKGRKILNTLSTISNRMRANAVMGNANSIIAQFFNLPNVAGYAKNPVDMANGFKTALQAATGNKEAKALLDKSMFLNERYLDRSFRRFNSGIVKDTEKFFGWMMEIGDKAIADGAWATFYNQAIKKGMPENEAIMFADEFTRKSVGGRGIAEMPLSQKAKVTKLIAPFQVEVRNAVNVLKDLGSDKDIGGIVAVFATSFLMNELLKATTGREIGFNPIGTAVDSIQDGSNVAAGLAGNALTNMPGGSYIASAGAGMLGLNEYQMQELFGQNDPSRFGTGNIALQTLGAPIGQAVKGQNIDVIKPLAAILPRFGGKQIERSIRGLQDMAVLPKEQLSTEGASLEKQEFPASYSPSGKLRFAIEPTAQNYITAPTLGTWSTPEGKAYIENQNKAMGDKDTLGVEKLIAGGVAGTDAEKFVRDFPDKVTDQRKAIMGSDLSAKQKNIAGKYLVKSDKNVDYSNQTNYEFSMLSNSAKEDFKNMKNIRKDQYVAAHNAMKGKETVIGKAIALKRAGYDQFNEQFGISKNTAGMADAIAANGLERIYDDMHSKMSGANESETKRRMIDINYPNLPYQQKIILYEAFNVSQKVGQYKRQFNE